MLLNLLPITRRLTGCWRRAVLMAPILLALGATTYSLDVAAQRDSIRNQGVSSGQAANIARNASGGKVLSVTPSGQYYQVRVLLDNGVVRTLYIERRTGRVSR